MVPTPTPAPIKVQNTRTLPLSLTFMHLVHGTLTPGPQRDYGTWSTYLSHLRY